MVILGMKEERNMVKVINEEEGKELSGNVLVRLGETQRIINELPQEVIDLLKRTIAKGSTNAELNLLLYMASNYNLDPLLKEIWFYKIDGQPIIMASRDGFLKVAKQDKNYDGLSGAVVREGDLFELDPVNSDVKHKFGSKRGKIIGAWAMARHKKRKPVVAFVPFSEYNRKNKVWNAYPEAMILKVAEVHALRKQFGVSGLYSSDEFDYDSGKPVKLHDDGSFSEFEDLEREIYKEIDEKGKLKKKKEDVVVDGEIVEESSGIKNVTPETVKAVKLSDDDKKFIKETQDEIDEDKIKNKEELDKILFKKSEEKEKEDREGVSAGKNEKKEKEDSDENNSAVRMALNEMESMGLEIDRDSFIEKGKEMLRENRITVLEFREIKRFSETL